VKTKFLSITVICLFATLCAQEKKPDTRALVSALVRSETDLKQVPFAQIVQAATGKNVIPFDTSKEVDRELLSKIGNAMDEVLKRLNMTNSSAQKQRRINEVSSHFETEMKRVLNEIPGFECDFPKTAQGKVQRSGYPDLRLVEKKTGRVVYLDPKLYEKRSRTSSFRTFYFEPKTDTNKINDDAHHLIVGFEHDGRPDGFWKFSNWDLVDISQFRVHLKAEFQGSNRDLYQPELIVGSSRK
jgi:hypothetical protein